MNFNLSQFTTTQSKKKGITMKQNTNTLSVISLFKLVLLVAGAFFLLFPNN